MSEYEAVRPPLPQLCYLHFPMSKHEAVRPPLLQLCYLISLCLNMRQLDHHYYSSVTSFPYV